MKRFLLLLMASTLAMGVPGVQARADDNTPKLVPSETCLFAHRDTCDLYLDIYEPTPGSETTFQGIRKPTLLFVFGGGFITGSRTEQWYHPWFKQYLDDGYRIVAIDYRLGLKGIDMKFDVFHLFQSCRLTKKAVDMGVEDVFSAVKFLIDNKKADADNIVVMGNSAGAMISLSSELEACNGWSGTGTMVEGKTLAQAAGLPEGFHFKGVMSFAGAVMTVSGVPSYSRTPAPQLLIHGDRDGAVTYGKTAFGKFGMYGSSAMVKDVFAKNGYIYHFYRYLGHSHDMAANMVFCMKEQFRFLEEEVMLGRGRVIDVSVNDPAMPVGIDINLDTIYG
ncbi:MAG: alpha/beta hydrolase fold domain-containing protein [Bacteroidales bacterium]|nr:alpha/beta hydrolase fold domain-containing protein [Bacteroidales bacterium]